jgi:hypothetical protein
MLANHAAEWESTGRFVIGVFHTLSAGNMGQFGAPGSGVPAEATAFPPNGMIRASKPPISALAPSAEVKRELMYASPSRVPNRPILAQAPLDGDHLQAAFGRELLGCCEAVVFAITRPAAGPVSLIHSSRDLNPVFTRIDGSFVRVGNAARMIEEALLPADAWSWPERRWPPQRVVLRLRSLRPVRLT